MNAAPIKSLFNHLLSFLGVPPMPAFVSIEPSAVCQLHCPQCPRGLGEKAPGQEALMSMNTFETILHNCQGWVHTIQFFFQGEPLLNQHLPDMIARAHQAHIYTICSTNAQALTPLLAHKIVASGLDRIIVSIDGLSEESYEAYRQGGSLNKALNGLIYLRQAKEEVGSHIHIELQCLRLKSNEHEWALFRRSYQQMGADSLTLKTAQFYTYKQGDALMPSNNKYSRYQQMADGSYRPKNRVKEVHHSTCRRLVTGCVITVNGDVLPCCFDKAAQYCMGNIHTSSLRTIWHSQAFSLFRKQVYNSRSFYAICQNCTEN